MHVADYGVLILDYGSQYTLLIARRLREIGIYAEVIDGRAEKANVDFDVKGIILSGGPDSVYEESGRALPRWVLEKKVPVLGICYGMQLLVQHFGGVVTSGSKREYGRAEVRTAKTRHKIFSCFERNATVWMSHGDHAEEVAVFETAMKTSDHVPAAIQHKEHPYFGLQFHPEVEHTTAGKDFLESFVTEVCKLKKNWLAQNQLESCRSYITERITEKDRVLVACSGGVDSTVLAALCGTTLKPAQVTVLFCNTGLLRLNEVEEVTKSLHGIGLKNIVVLDSAQKFLSKLRGVSDPETKRKIAGMTFIEEFERFASGKNFTHLAQGTLYPDVIESAGHGAGAKVIKTHHNVGGLPEKLALKLCEPFRFLFKDEVRKIGEALKLPHDLVYRHPFPGPGLAVRILGEVSEEKVELLQKADAIFIQALRDEGLYEKIWQAFAVLLPVKTVGVMGDNRTYQFTCALRAIHSIDGMTADVTHLPMEFLTRVSDRIIRQVPGINRVVYDITSKPPATIEWE